MQHDTNPSAYQGNPDSLKRCRRAAALQAAAPDLLAALRDLEWACSGVEYMESEYSEQLAQARAALNKAIGE